MIFLYYLFDGGAKIFIKHKKIFWRGMNILMVMVVSHLYTHVFSSYAFCIVQFIIFQLHPNRVVEKESPPQRAAVKMKCHSQ